MTEKKKDSFGSRLTALGGAALVGHMTGTLAYQFTHLDASALAQKDFMTILKSDEEKTRDWGNAGAVLFMIAGGCVLARGIKKPKEQFNLNGNGDLAHFGSGPRSKELFPSHARQNKLSSPPDSFKIK